MRPLVSGRPLVLVAASAVLALTAGVLPAVADENAPPSQAEVDAAKDAADDKARTVAAVQADLVMANQRVQDASIAVAQAYEDWNAATWALTEARRDARAAERRAGTAEKALKRQEVAYGAMLAATYEMSPDVTALSALADEDGFQGVVETSNTMYGLTSSMDTMKQAYRAAVAVADVATNQAERARDRAADLAEKAAAARDAARALEADAAAEAASVGQERDALIRELATLQDISVSLAARRQADLEAAAQARSAAAAEAEAAAQARSAAAAEAEAAPAQQAQAAPQPQPDPEPAPDPEPQPDPEPAPDPEPEPDPTPPPAAGPAAQRAISFARDQLGEDYSWGATGPNSWDCSGLTMRSWEHAGKWIGRTSRQQYAQATRISHAQLRPGDLLFWTNSGPSNIYHVAMYTGNGMMIHAPNSSRPVVEESMYYWPPQLYARP